MATQMDNIQALVKALEAGSYNAAPSSLTQGAALQIEDLSPVMVNVTFEDKHLILQKMLSKKTCKSTLAQFDRQLSYGIFGGSAQLEGHIGQENTSDFVRMTNTATPLNQTVPGFLFRGIRGGGKPGSIGRPTRCESAGTRSPGTRCHPGRLRHLRQK